MNKPPPCPKCGEDELWVQAFGPSLRVSCYYCNWTIYIQLPATVAERDAAIEAAVKAAREELRA